MHQDTSADNYSITVTTFRDIALPLAERGIKVIPVRPLSKRVVLGDQFRHATTSAEQIERWNAENPNYNVGCVGSSMTVGQVLKRLNHEHDPYPGAIWQEQDFDEFRKPVCKLNFRGVATRLSINRCTSRLWTEAVTRNRIRTFLHLRISESSRKCVFK